MSKAGGIMVFAITLSRILGMVRNTVMASKFGLGLDADSYAIAILIPDMLFLLVAGGGLSSAFIPVFTEYWQNDKKDQAWKIFSVVLSVSFLVATFLVGVAWVYSPQIVDYFRDNKPIEVAPKAIEMSRIMLPAQVAFLCGSVMLGTLYARRIFLGPALAPNVYNLGIILGAMFLPRMMGLGIESMAWGALGGAIIGNVLIPALMMAKEGSSFRPSLDVKTEGVKQFFVLLLPILLGFSLPSMVNFITQKFASSYNQTGLNIVLSSANNLMQAPLGIFGQALALAAFPVLAEFAATNQMPRYRDQVSKTLRTVLYVGVPSGALMFAFAPQIVNVLYGYGQAARSHNELNQIVECLRIYSFAIFAWCVQPILMRGFFSIQKTFKPIAVSTLMTLVFIGLCVVATKTSTQYQWIPWATNVAAILLGIALFGSLEREVGKLDRTGVLLTLAKSTGAAIVAGGFGYFASMLWNPVSKISNVGSLGVLGLCAMWVYFFCTRFLKMPETAYFDRALDRLNRRKDKEEAQ